MQQHDGFHWHNVEQKKPDTNEYIQYLCEKQKQAKPSLSDGSQSIAYLQGGDKDLEGGWGRRLGFW